MWFGNSLMADSVCVFHLYSNIHRFEWVFPVHFERKVNVLSELRRSFFAIIFETYFQINF